MSKEYRYRALTPAEEYGDDRLLVDKALKIISHKLGLRNVALYFMTADPFGEIVFDDPIGGACPPEGDRIYILRGLPRRDIVRVVAHELRHSYQRKNRKPRAMEDRERDCRIFELETNPPADDKIVRWLVEQELD
jgi:hypothetical protein